MPVLVTRGVCRVAWQHNGGEQVDRVCGLAVDMNNCVIVSRYSKIEMF